jgi:hypothetical protein
MVGLRLTLKLKQRKEGKIIFPPKYEKVEGPLIFIAGPIQGAMNWQKLAIEIIRSMDSEINIACPRRVLDREKDKKFVYEEQVDWETHYLNRAGANGAIMFWLAKEFRHTCERAYAQTSRFELGEWKTKHQLRGIKLTVGIEEGFTGARYMKRRLSQDCPDVPVLSNLEETCRKAVELSSR